MIDKIRKHYVGPVAGRTGLAFLLIFMLISIIIVVKLSGGQTNYIDQSGKAFENYISELVEQKVGNVLMPLMFYRKNEHIVNRLTMLAAGEVLPLYSYGWADGMVHQKEGQYKNIESTELELIRVGEYEEQLQTTGGENMKDPGINVIEQMQFENQQAAAALAPDISVSAGFVPHTVKLAQIDMTSLQDYETLVENFYTIDKSTMIGSDQLNVEKMLSVDMRISKEAEGPQILIYHTHSQEGFADSVEGDSSTTIVGVGEYLAQLLTDEYGYQVLHHTGQYDVPSRDDAYSVALPEIEKLLTQNPQIQVVIDLHRDAMDENTRLVTEVDGRPTARFMFFNGLSRTRKTGNISYLYNENLDNNLAFSFQLQKAALEYYPGLTRKIYLKAYRYNMHLRPHNLLIELGAQNNTLEEARNACLPLAHLLDMVLSGYE